MVSDGKSFEYFNSSSILAGGYFDKKSEGINLGVKLEKFYVKKEISNRCYVNVIAPMFKKLDIDGSGEVPIDNLIEKLLLKYKSLSKDIIKRKFLQVFPSQVYSDLKLTSKDFFILLFCDLKSEKIQNFLKSSLKPEPKSLNLPDLVSTRTHNSPLKLNQRFKPSPYIHSNEINQQDQYRILFRWWEELSKGKNDVQSNDLAKFLFRKGFSSSFEFCKEVVDCRTGNWDFNEFFGFFVFALIRNLVEDEEKNISCQRMSKSFLPNYRKIKYVQKNINLVSFSPDPVKSSYEKSQRIRLKRLFKSFVMS